VTNIPLTPSQRFALRHITRLLDSAYEIAERRRGPFHKPQFRGLTIWDTFCQKVVAWVDDLQARGVKGIEIHEKVPTLVLVVDDVAFVVRKAGVMKLERLAMARLAYNAVERRRIAHTLAVQERTLFADPDAEAEAAELGVLRYVHVVHVGRKELVDLWIGERIGKRWWAGEERLPVAARPQPVSGPTLLAFDRGEIPPLPEVQPLDEAASDRPTAGRFKDEQAGLDLDVASRPAQDDQQGTDEGA
jgi:hypothetical protein